MGVIGGDRHVVREDPGVFAAAALGRIDDERAFLQGDASQAARQNEDILSIKNIGTEIHVSAFKMAIHDRRYAGQGEGGLGDVISRIGRDAFGEFAALVGG